MKHPFLLTLSLALTAAWQLCAQTPEYRLWTVKATGSQIEATMISADATTRTVTIQGKDNQVRTVPITLLVDADLAYIKQKLSAAPAAPASAPTAPPAPAAADKTAKAAPAAPMSPTGPPAPPRPVVTVIPAKKYKFPAGGAVLGAVKRERPRTLLNAAGMAALKGRLDGDAVAKGLFDSLKATSEKVIELPELVQQRGEGRGPSIGGKAIFRMTGLGILNYVDADPRWKDYAVREMVSISSFTNWKPDELKELAEFVWGMSIGYDMFRKSMNAEQEKKIKAALIELGVDSLVALFKGEELPPTVKRPEPGQAPNTKGIANKRPAIAASEEPDAEEMVAACALLTAAIALVDEEPNKAGPAATLACKTINAGISHFAPDGIWSEGVYPGDEVLDALGSLIMTLRAATGGDFGLSSVEGLPNAGTARVHLTGPAGVFNYGDATGTALARTWVTSFLAAFYGNPGVPALKAPKGPSNTEAEGMSIAGQLLYHSPFMSGYATPETLDAAFAGAGIATVRSAWNDPGAFFIAMKGGKNEVAGGHLDLGTFVLDAGGVRWAIDLGGENERALRDKKNPAKFANYRENTFGQNTWRFGPGLGEKDTYKPVAPKKGPPDPPKDSQPLDAKAPFVGFSSTAERGAAVIDLTDAYSSHAKDFHRGILVTRGETPTAIIQDELKIKSGDPEWVMHTRAEVTVSGNKATLKSGNKTLTMTLLSPASAAFIAEDPPEQKEPLSSLKGIKVIKVPLTGMKGEQTVSVAFTLGEAPPAVPLTPLAQWLGKKR